MLKGEIFDRSDHLSVSITYTVNKSRDVIHMLSTQERNWYVRWAYESGTDACTEHKGQEMMHVLSEMYEILHVPSKHAVHTRKQLGGGGCVH